MHLSSGVMGAQPNRHFDLMFVQVQVQFLAIFYADVNVCTAV